VNTVCNNDGAVSLSLTGVGGFSPDKYFSSSKFSGDAFVWSQDFLTGDQTSPTFKDQAD
jgi:hypothetical protein